MSLGNRKRFWIGIGTTCLVVAVIITFFGLSAIRLVQQITNVVPGTLRVGDTTVCVPRTWFLLAKRERKEAPALTYGFLPESWIRAVGIETHALPEAFFLFRANMDNEKLGILITEIEPNRATRLSRRLGVSGSSVAGNGDSERCHLIEEVVSGIPGITLQCPTQAALKTIEFPSIRLAVSVPTSELQRLNEIKLGCEQQHETKRTPALFVDDHAPQRSENIPMADQGAS